jgi:polysaccharide deacetylase family protein (PEP-CTERM system associated)
MTTTAATPSSPIRCITIDVEEYFHIEAAHAAVPRADWTHWPSRVERNVDLLLDLFNDHHCKATFFLLAAVARAHPHLARRCLSAGHEIASHGSMHDRLHRLSPQSFRDDLTASKNLLEDQLGEPILGYRAPTWSVTRTTAWAIDVLADVGFTYDASIFPVRHPWYGIPDAPTSPYFVHSAPDEQPLLELPPLTYRFAGKNFPVAGGGYFRLLPLAFMRRGLAQAQRQNRPAILYFHPWEFDPDMPRLPLSFTGRLRTYTGLRSAAPRLRKILASPGEPWNTLAYHLPTFRQIAREMRPFTLTSAPTAAPA